VREPRAYFEQGQYEEAIDRFKKLVAREDNDQLLYLMDLGIVYHSAGRFQESIETFLKADKLAEIKDYTSLAQEAASVLLSDEVKPYKGEDFEKILINVYLAMDYTLSHQWDDALVECRKVNHKLDLMISQGGLPYKRNAFAKYLAATLFEARREWNDAFVDYREVFKWMREFAYLGPPLLRVADKLKAVQEFEELKKKFPDVQKYRIGKEEGEIVLLVEQGRAPIKVPAPEFHLLPKFQRRPSFSDYVWIRDKDGSHRARSQPLFDIEGTAIRELEGRVAGIVAKKVGGIVAKQIVAHQVAKHTKSQELGVLTAIVLHSTDTADLRSWTTLPARLQLARIVVPAGRHDMVIDMVSTSGFENRGVKQFDGVEVKPGETVFLHYRVD